MRGTPLNGPPPPIDDWAGWQDRALRGDFDAEGDFGGSIVLQFCDTFRADVLSGQMFVVWTGKEAGFFMDSKQKRRHAAETFAHAITTGEVGAVDRARSFLAPDVVVSGSGAELVGREAVIASITGAKPHTAIFRSGGWSDAEAWGDGVVVRAEFPRVGSGPTSLTLAFSFNEHDEITRVEKSVVQTSRPESTPEIPLVVKGLIDNAQYHGTPLVMAYISEEDEPIQSVEGSARVFGPTQISIWLSSRESSLAKAVRRNRKISLLYRDSRLRTSLVIRGQGRITLDEDVCRRVYEFAPEIEQHHDPDREGVALIIDVDEIRGETQSGGVLVRP